MAHKPAAGTLIDLANPLFAGVQSCLYFLEAQGTAIFDSSGHGNAGTVEDTAAFWKTDPDFGPYLQLARTNGTGISVPYCVDPTGSFTAACLVDVQDAASPQDLLSQADGTGGTGRSWMSVNSGTLRSFLGGISTVGPTLAAGRQFCAVTYDGTTLALYLQTPTGTLQSVSAVRSSALATGRHIWGANKAGTGLQDFIGGEIANLLSQRCFSAAEVGTLADAWLSYDWLISTPGVIVFTASGPGGITCAESAAPTGGTPPFTRQWQRSDNGGAYADLAGQTGTSLTDATAVAGVAYRYRLHYTDAGTGDLFSNEVGPLVLYNGGTLGGGHTYSRSRIVNNG